MTLSLRKVLAPLAVLAGFASTPSHAASLNTDVGVTVPSVISLYCYDRVVANLEQFNVDLTGTGPGLSEDAVGTPGNLEVTGPPLPYNTFNATGIVSIRNPSRLFLKGVCAFRALAGASGVQVSITPLNTVLEGPFGSSITLSRYRVRDGATGGIWTPSYNVDTTAGGLSELHEIEIRMRMTMSAALYYGTYSSATDGTFAITVVANP